jgi:hypothetical protein
VTEATFVESHLVGFFDPSFVAGDRVLMSVEEGAEGMLAPEATPMARIDDARHLQGEAAPAAFFEHNGFVLLPHESAVKDWDVDPMAPNNELTRTYVPEVEDLIRTRLLPGRRLDIWQGPAARRGPGTSNPDYAGGVHQDFGLTPDDYQEAIEVFVAPEIGAAWRNRFEQEDVLGFLSINFWRPVGMSEPLRHMPLGFCHPASVEVDDVVPVGLLDFTPTGKPSNQLGIRYDAKQRWYHYSAMTCDEVLVLKQFQFFKDDPTPSVETCFHTAFELPNTPSDAEPRQSSEHRVLVFVLKD